ncbi:XRE family transcriptional regulator [Streptomyces sp. NPDC000349]|uniref:helix-turn-helix domain-containing protein n=1 Tax=unclassified Streptomyces TaxID=2593676 RepID=UPI002784ABA1|nr:XRE family transcriptional regulator [Streptomyces sp. DSM 40167]MDQ0404853.1 Zn-dependent peptidase ImmA (M78 family)/transcriptional regulator with XRE-family HTH domain [Streptomyces sp. DSM 40167]
MVMNSSRRTDVRVGDVSRLFDGRRLTLARQLIGLRKNALAAKIDKSPTAVAAYENNTKRPAPATVAQLCLTLGVDPGFFLPGPHQSTGSDSVPHFRSLRSTTQLARDQAFAYGVISGDVGAALERHVEFPEPNLPRLSVDVEDESSSLPEEAARLLRKHWDIASGPVGHLVRLAENHGVVVVFSPTQTAAVDAYSFDDGYRPTVVLNPAKEDYYRQRFDVAHEIGHLVMHVDAEPGSKVVENQAHRFAAELLLPEEELRDLLPSKADWRILARLKETYGVSLQALLYRSRALGVMSDVTYRNAIAYLSSKGWRRREPGEMPAVEQPSLYPKAVEILSGVGMDEISLAKESRVTPGIFRTVTARSPVREELFLATQEIEGTDEVIPLFRSKDSEPGT